MAIFTLAVYKPLTSGVPYLVALTTDTRVVQAWVAEDRQHAEAIYEEQVRTYPNGEQKLAQERAKRRRKRLLVPKQGNDA
mgnify:CR=1 FL=1|jgi:hypothetical protein